MPTAFCLFYDFMLLLDTAVGELINLGYRVGSSLGSPRASKVRISAAAHLENLLGLKPRLSDFYLDHCSLALFASSVLLARPM